MNRRLLIASASAALLSAPFAHAQGGANISPEQAHRLASAKHAILVDIRTPEEWAETGVAAGAVRIDMTDPAFLRKLDAAMGNDRTRPVALICRTANRTRAVQQALMRRGYTQVLNVEGGMVGNRADRGWIARGLPVVR